MRSPEECTTLHSTGGMPNLGQLTPDRSLLPTPVVATARASQTVCHGRRRNRPCSARRPRRRSAGRPAGRAVRNADHRSASADAAVSPAKETGRRAGFPSRRGCVGRMHGDRPDCGFPRRKCSSAGVACAGRSRKRGRALCRFRKPRHSSFRETGLPRQRWPNRRDRNSRKIAQGRRRADRSPINIPEEGSRKPGLRRSLLT